MKSNDPMKKEAALSGRFLFACLLLFIFQSIQLVYNFAQFSVISLGTSHTIPTAHETVLHPWKSL